MNAFNKMNPQSRLWIFQSNKILKNIELEYVNKSMTEYLKTWNAHGDMLIANFTILHNVFLIISVDESKIGASGCSIDELISHIRKLGHDFKIEFLDRSLVCYRNREQTILFMNRSKFKEFIKNGGKKEISKVFDITIQRLSDIDFLEKNFDDSWHAKAFMS